MNKFIRPVVAGVMASLLAVQPAWAVRGGAVGGRGGGGAAHYSGPRGSGTAVQGPRGGTAVHTSGAYHSRTAVHGAYGGGAVHNAGPYGSRTYVHGGGPGHYARPAWNSAHIDVYRRGFHGYPGWRPYGVHYGLIGPLVGMTSLAFLSSGLLIGSYVANQQTVYVYVVEENGQQIEYRVDQAGNVISRTVVQ